MRVLFRAWLHGAWTIDRNQPNGPKSHWEVDLAAELAPALVARQSAKAPDVPPEYLGWLKRRCADVSLLGQEVQHSDTIRLGHVYVPALTAAADGLDLLGSHGKSMQGPLQRGIE